MPKRKRPRPKKTSSRKAVKGQKFPSLSAAQSRKRERFQTRKLPIIILLLVSFVAYANAWPNALIWDDSVFALGNRISGQTWANVRDSFTRDVWASLGLDTGLYRPLLLASVSVDIFLFGEWKAGYHLVNILLHALCSVAVFGLIRHLLEKCETPPAMSSYVALLAALVFAVHPVHTEVVNSVFNRSEMLVTLGVAGGMWWFLPTVERKPWRAWIILGVIYLLAMLARETGIVLPGIAVVLLWLTTPGAWQARVRRCLPVFWLLVPMGIYLGLRAQALDAPMTLEEVSTTATAASASASAGASKEIHNIPVLGMYLDFNKILPAVAVWFDAFKLMLWPHPLLTFHTKPEINHWLALATQAALFVFAATRALQRKPGLFMGLMFFYLAILPASRIVGDARVIPHLAERYLYMPSAGATIMLAFGIAWLVQKSSLKQAVIAVMTAMIILTPLTWMRNSKWASAELLAETDIDTRGKLPKLMQAYISTLLMNNKLPKAARVCDENVRLQQGYWFLASYCGQVYASLGYYDKAEQAFSLSIERPRGRSSAHYALAVMYLGMGRRDDASEQFDLAVDTEAKAFLKEYLAAEKLMRLYPANQDRLNEARQHMEKSIELQPQYFHARKRLEDLNMMINNIGGSGN